MTSFRRRVVGCLTCAGVAGLVYPYGELMWKCRAGPFDSEACVWARAYFPLSRWVEPVVVTPIVFVLTLLFFAITDRKR